MIPVHRGAVTPGQERTDDVTPGVERQRMRADLGDDRLVAAQG
jgi:hypothetical protein